MKSIPFETRYSEARDGDDLLEILSEGVGIAAARVFLALKPPLRRAIIRAFTRVFRASEFDGLEQQEATLLIHTVLAVLQRLLEFLRGRISDSELEHVLDAAGFMACSDLSRLAGRSEEGLLRLEVTYISLVTDFEDVVSGGRPVSDHERLKLALGRNPTVREMGSFLREVRMKDPILLAKPWVFAERWNAMPPSLRLKG